MWLGGEGVYQQLKNWSTMPICSLVPLLFKNNSSLFIVAISSIFEKNFGNFQFGLRNDLSTGDSLIATNVESK